ncbi:hypothetical protein LTR22_026054 [Elasticomyces elasticus]|nr:hypothetical protein LTR22_026054 [Elasticomyces elasticus]
MEFDIAIDHRLEALFSTVGPASTTPHCAGHIKHLRALRKTIQRDIRLIPDAEYAVTHTTGGILVLLLQPANRAESKA